MERIQRMVGSTLLLVALLGEPSFNTYGMGSRSAASLRWRVHDNAPDSLGQNRSAARQVQG